MDASASRSHSVTARLGVDAADAFRFMSDPLALGEWALGCMRTRHVGPDGLHAGTSIFDGATAWFHIEADPRLMLVDYHLGTPERRAPRISARVVPGPVCGMPEGTCLVTLTAWRDAAMTDERWRRLCVAHEAEILIVQSQCEARFGAASGRGEG